jgi:hypothetical protein
MPFFGWLAKETRCEFREFWEFVIRYAKDFAGSKNIYTAANQLPKLPKLTAGDVLTVRVKLPSGETRDVLTEIPIDLTARIEIRQCDACDTPFQVDESHPRQRFHDVNCRVTGNRKGITPPRNTGPLTHL